MDAYSQHTGCLMEFLAAALDDPAAAACGRCAWCKGQPEALRRVPEQLMRDAIVFLRRCDLPIEPRVNGRPALCPFMDGKDASPPTAAPRRAVLFVFSAIPVGAVSFVAARVRAASPTNWFRR